MPEKKKKLLRNGARNYRGAVSSVTAAAETQFPLNCLFWRVKCFFYIWRTLQGSIVRTAKPHSEFSRMRARVRAFLRILVFDNLFWGTLKD